MFSRRSGWTLFDKKEDVKWSGQDFYRQRDKGRAATEDQATKLGVFCTAPSIPNLGLNIFSEAVGTFILVFAIKGMANVPELTDGLGKFIVFGIIVSIGMSLGGLTGYAINPARDLGPRLAHAVLPIKGKGSSNWGYGIVTLIGPVIGAVAAVLLFGAIPW